MSSSPRAPSPLRQTPSSVVAPAETVPLNAWLARAGAFAETAQVVRGYIRVLESPEGAPTQTHLRELLDWVVRCQSKAESESGQPITTTAEHIVRKATRAFAAAAKAWRES